MNIHIKINSRHYDSSNPDEFIDDVIKEFTALGHSKRNVIAAIRTVGEQGLNSGLGEPILKSDFHEVLFRIEAVLNRFKNAN